MKNKQHKNFLFINITLLLTASFIILCGIIGLFRKNLHIFFSTHYVIIFFLSFCFFCAGFLFFFLCIKLLKIKPDITPEYKKSKILFLIIGYVFYFIALFLLVLKQWGIDRFPIDQPEIVYFTLLNINGAVIDKSIYYEAVILLIKCLLLSSVFFFIIFICERKNKYYYLFIKNKKATSINFLYLIWGLFIFIFSFADSCYDLNVVDYAKVIEKYSKHAIDSDFYLSEYVVPEDEKIIFPENKKNLIIILMESMESSFADKENGGVMNKNLIPNLTRIANENINFSNTDKVGGGIDLAGTGWTIAGMLAKFAGLPFNLTGDANHNRSFFLPGAVTLTDILGRNGYKQIFMFGSDKQFAGRDALLETHGNVEVHDTTWYKNNKMLPNSYSVFWGFEDKKLFNFAKYELSNLSKTTQPFMLGLLTVDTHMPTGYKCEECPDTEDMPLKNAILCSDMQVSAFIDWCKTQPWYDDTVIVIMGDHLFMVTEDTNPFGKIEDDSRRWLDIFINSNIEKDSKIMQNRVFSSFDMFPTILSAIGCDIEGNKLGFGVNLFCDEKTLCERFSIDYLNSEIMVRNRLYENMEYMFEEK